MSRRGALQWLMGLTDVETGYIGGNARSEKATRDIRRTASYMKLTTIGFDADDTLWQNERFLRADTGTIRRTARRVYAERAHLDERLLEAEKRNIGHYGYGIKGFMLSMIETAIEVTDAKVPAWRHPGNSRNRPGNAAPPDRAPAACPRGGRGNGRIASQACLLITKGDLLDQERKLAESALWEFFDRCGDCLRERLPTIYAAYLHRTWRRTGTRDDGGQFDEIRCAASNRGRGLGRACPLRPRLGRWKLPIRPTGHERFRTLNRPRRAFKISLTRLAEILCLLSTTLRPTSCDVA